MLVLLQLWVKTRGAAVSSAAHEHRVAAWGAGSAMGFATMTANAAGAVMTDPITREQVERAIVAARVGTVYLSDFLGPGIKVHPLAWAALPAAPEAP